MAKLTTKKRNALAVGKFGLPSERKYPLNNSSHARNAIGRATQMVNKGKLSASTAAKIKSKARKVLGKGKK